jgi:hypothetical protein
MAAAVVRELGLMYLVSGSKTYKTASSAVTQALGRISNVPIKVEGVNCKMTFMVVDTDIYDILLGLDLLIKIGAIVDVEQGLIQVRKGPGADVEVLPLTMVNLIQKSDSVVGSCNEHCKEEGTPGEPEIMDEASYLCQHNSGGQIAELESETDSGSSEDSDGENQTMGAIEEESEFGNTELDELVLTEGPQQILQFTLQDKAADFMKEEVTDDDDYVGWIQWAAEAERCGRKPMKERKPGQASELPQLQQLQVANDQNDYVKERIMKNPKEETRWGEICQKIRIDQHLDKGMERQLWQVLEQYQDVFAWNKGELGCCKVGEHLIDTQGFPPCQVAPSRLSYWEEAEVNRQINVLVELGKMRPSNSAYACRVTLPVKKDGSKRFCGDYRPLNLQTRRDSFPMPLVEDVISQLGKSAWFTALDLQSGFWQIRMGLEDMGKTALVTKSGLFEWTVMPFGLKNATSTFARTMTEIFKDLGNSFLKIFVDDLNVHSVEWQAHLQHLEAVLSRLREVNLKLNPSKCCFAAASVVFLGHIVSKEGTRPDPSKINAVWEFPAPTTVVSVRSFLGLTGYYRRFIRGYAKLAGPLFELTKKDVDFIWNEDCQRAFGALKRALIGAPILVRPNFKESFLLDVDWSTKGVGAILSQKEGRFERVIAYASKALTVAQKKFHPMEGECYALIWGILHFKRYLHRTHFTLRTDHKPLEWLATVSDAHGRRGRWIDLLQDYSFKIVHRPGARHTNADALSRNPVGQAMDDEDFL